MSYIMLVTLLKFMLILATHSEFSFQQHKIIFPLFNYTKLNY